MAEYDNEYNLRQYRLMIDLLERYKRGVLGIDKLISNLSALLDCLQGIDKKWQNEFQHKWGMLEDTYATSLDMNKGKVIFSSEDSLLIGKAIDGLNELINQKLKEPEEQG